MQIEINPFQELYVTETAEPAEFVRLFSPYLVEHAQLLYSHGNVVLKGTQGCGKSMLLNLLRPDIRAAYFDAKKEFPLSAARLRRFISAGINITRSGVTYIGQRPIGKDPECDEALFPLFFADFVNYWIVIDLLRSLEYMTHPARGFDDVIRADALNEFAKRLSQGMCWFGFLDGIEDYRSLRAKMESRITTYRSFHQANINYLPANIQETKTTIGEPISWAADCMWDTKLLPDDYHVFVRIDQHEFLSRSDDLRPELGEQYRRVINKALSTRDPRISYKVGTRRYAWDENMVVFRTDQKLEKERDYRVIDLDDLLRRQEVSSTWVFPAFARDVFMRRLEYGSLETYKGDLLRKVFKSAEKPNIVASEYVGNSHAERALNIDNKWPTKWKSFLRTLFDEDPLSAKLAEAWLRQQIERAPDSCNLEKLLPKTTPYPWNKTYWKKERIRQAQMQLASRCGQRLLWSGAESVIALSGASTLIFLSICQHIWDVFLRSQRGLPDKLKTNPRKSGIKRRIQAVGIQTASTYWYHKITEQPDGNDRQRFIDYLGRVFQESMLGDNTMSSPGANGFSILKDGFESDEQLKRFLGDAVDYGNLVDAPHTTKYKDRKQRIKWYLNPIYSPYYRIPESHVKEPVYVTVNKVREWIKESGVSLGLFASIPPTKSREVKDNSGQLTLPFSAASKSRET